MMYHLTFLVVFSGSNEFENCYFDQFVIEVDDDLNAKWSLGGGLPRERSPRLLGAGLEISRWRPNHYIVMSL